MRSIRSHSPAMAARTITLITLFLSTASAMIQFASPENNAHPELRRRGQTYSGCYSSSTPLHNFATAQYQSTGLCGTNCTSINQAVMGLTGSNDCWCGDELPAVSSKVDDSSCNLGCTGYGSIKCGGDGFWSVYLTGLEDSVPTYGGSSSSSSSGSATTGSGSTSTAKPTVITSVAPGTTVVVTEAPTATSTQSSGGGSSGGGHSNTAGIAAGVVVAIVAVAAIIGGLYFFFRRRNRQAAEEEYQRSTQVSDFMRGGERKAPGTGYSFGSDSRLDPEAGRRNSVGSLADNQDYSRRILRVANPDSS